MVYSDNNNFVAKSVTIKDQNKPSFSHFLETTPSQKCKLHLTHISPKPSSLTAVKLHSIDPHLHWASLRRSSPPLSLTLSILMPSHTSPLFPCMPADRHRRRARPPSHRSRASTSSDCRSTSPLTLSPSLMLTVSNALITLSSTNNTKCFQTLEFNFIYLY